MTHYSKLLGSGILAFLLIFNSCKKNLQETPGLISKNTQPGLSQRPDEPGFAENDMVMTWNDKTAIVLGAPMTQPSRTRLFAIVQIAVHDALNNIKPKYERFALEDPKRFANPNAAVASAAHKALIGLGRNHPQLNFWLDSSLATIPAGESKTLGIALGIQAANTVIASRINDGITQIIAVSTTPLDGDEPGEYRSTLAYIGGILGYIQPPVKRVYNWGTVMKPYVLLSNHQFRQPGPEAVNTLTYATDYNEVKTKGAKVGSTRTVNEAMMARFWSENRPSLTWNNLTREAIKNKKMDAWKTARLFALVHTSLAETINTTMNTAYHFYFWRPETGIRLAATDGNSMTEPDAGWLPFLEEIPNAFPSPPQPGYGSSFTGYGGATAETLRLFFESDNSHISLKSATLPGITMQFSSFSQAARQNSISMVYAGWEFRNSALDGEEMGKQIANFVFNNQFREE
jgi:hypothetical protein